MPDTVLAFCRFLVIEPKEHTDIIPIVEYRSLLPKLALVFFIGPCTSSHDGWVIMSRSLKESTVHQVSQTPLHVIPSSSSYRDVLDCVQRPHFLKYDSRPVRILHTIYPPDSEHPMAAHPPTTTTLGQLIGHRRLSIWPGGIIEQELYLENIVELLKMREPRTKFLVDIERLRAECRLSVWRCLDVRPQCFLTEG